MALTLSTHRHTDTHTETQRYTCLPTLRGVHYVQAAADTLFKKTVGLAVQPGLPPSPDASLLLDNPEGAVSFFVHAQRRASKSKGAHLTAGRHGLVADRGGAMHVRKGGASFQQC
jgi:hypothetical protein